MARSRFSVSVENLEVRRLLARSKLLPLSESAYHTVGCDCGACRVFIPKDFDAISVDYAPSGSVGNGPAALADGGPEDTTRFNITLDFGSSITTSQQQIFRDAAAKWESVLIGDLLPAGGADDVIIGADVTAIDGPGSILGQAGPSGVRSASFGAQAFIPYQGNMQFDSADVGGWSYSYFLGVVLHEMGHVLGIGTIWSTKGLLTGSGSSDPRFTGSNALTQYKALKNASATSIPVENTGGPGTANSHWRESDLGSELMTGYANTTMPLSRITAASMIDLGYPSVNLDGSDIFTAPSGNALPVISTLGDSPDPVNPAVNPTITLTASGVSDANGISQVEFYRESNGIPGLQTGISNSDTAVGTDTTASAGAYSVTTSVTSLSDGSYTYYAKARDTLGAYSAIRSTVNVVDVQADPPDAPSQPLLAGGSDSGLSSSDGITNDTTPTFNGTATAGVTVTLLANGNSVGTGLADGNGNWSITASSLADGLYSITATATSIGGTSNASPATSLSVDTVGPIASNPVHSYLNELAVSFAFNEDVSGQLGNGSLLVTNLTTAQAIPAIFDSYSGNVAKFKFENNALPNGNYSAVVQGANVRDVAGNTATSSTISFFHLNGDTNRSRSVGFEDLLVVSQNYGSSGRNWSTGDFTYDGLVNFSDLLLLSQSYGTNLPALLLQSGGSGSLPASFSTQPITSPARRTTTMGRAAQQVLA